MCKCSKMPSALVNKVQYEVVKGDGDCAIVRTNVQVKERMEDKVFLEDHLLCYITKGSMETSLDDSKQCTLREHELLLMHKAQIATYTKIGNENGEFSNYLVYFTDEFLDSFMQKAKLDFEKPGENVCSAAKKMNPRIHAMFNSLDTYFDEPGDFDAPIISLKLKELLFEIANVNKNMLLQLFSTKQQVRSDILRVMEENYTKPVSVSDLAYLSGRSLASFKRDFKKVSTKSPSEWIKERRLKEAKHLLITTELAVKDICYTLGFENTAHFSKVYKEQYAVTPSVTRRTIAFSQS